jgi:hypothetical protein
MPFLKWTVVWASAVTVNVIDVVYDAVTAALIPNFALTSVTSELTFMPDSAGTVVVRL